MIRRKDSAPVPAITLTRLLYLAFCMSVSLIALVVVLQLGDMSPGSTDPVVARGLIGAVAAMAAIGIIANARRPWRVADATSAVSRLSTDTLIAAGLSETPALVAFVLCVMTGEVTTFWVGYALSLLLFILGAPTVRTITRRREELAMQGNTLDLAEALFRPRIPNNG